MSDICLPPYVVYKLMCKNAASKSSYKILFTKHMVVHIEMNFPTSLDYISLVTH